MRVKDDRVYISYIDDCIDRILDYTSEGREAFLKDRRTQDAVLRNLQTMAESTERLSDRLKARFPAVDWRAIAALRNAVVHTYLGIDLQQVWSIVERDLPPLHRHFEQIRRELGELD